MCFVCLPKPMKSGFKKIVLLFMLATMLSGCKIAVIVVEGGEVQPRASTTCQSESVCIHEVRDLNYTEGFTAVSAPGWEFVRWNSGSGFFCGDSTNPTCEISTLNFEGNAALESIVFSDATGYLMPIFRSLDSAPPGPVGSTCQGSGTIDFNEFRTDAEILQHDNPLIIDCISFEASVAIWTKGTASPSYTGSPGLSAVGPGKLKISSVDKAPFNLHSLDINAHQSGFDFDVTIEAALADGGYLSRQFRVIGGENYQKISLNYSDIRFLTLVSEFGDSSIFTIDNVQYSK